MLYDLIHNSPADPDRPAIVDAFGEMSWSALRELCRTYRDRFEECRGRRVAVLVAPCAHAVASLAALDAVDAAVYLFDADLAEPARQALANQLSLAGTVLPNPNPGGVWQLAWDSHPRPETGSGVTILTSGTEGAPKAASHSWESLLRPVRPSKSPQVWLLSYRLNLYAGLQVLLQSLVSGGTLAMSATADTPDEVVQLMITQDVRYVSATPSYWRRLLLFADRQRLRQLRLQQITLGGEAADQHVLNQLQQVFPKARIVHIYATTELGRCFSVSDGQAGFPLSYLEDSAMAGIELKVENGELYVRSKNRMRGYEGQRNVDDDEWFATGDMIEVDGQRALFAGRIGDLINVGGNKVRPVVVERIVRAIDGVADVRVYGQTSSITGQLVACDIVLDAGFDRDQVFAEVSARCRDQLRGPEVPRVLREVTEIPTSLAGKVVRSED